MLKKTVLVLLLIIIVGFSRATNPNPNQTNRQKWEEGVRSDIATLFETILDTRQEKRHSANYQAATDMVTKYEQQLPVKEKLGEVVVSNPLQEFLSAPYGNYPGGMANERPLQGIFYERAREKRAGNRQNDLDEIAKYFIEMTEPKFFTGPLTSTLNEKITGGDPKMIPYLLFALRYGMAKIAKNLLDNSTILAQAKIDGRSAYSYAFEGGISDPELLAALGKAGAIIQEADFDYFKDDQKKTDFLTWLLEHGIATKNVGEPKIRAIRAQADREAANRALNKFAQSLYGLVK